MLEAEGGIMVEKHHQVRKLIQIDIVYNEKCEIIRTTVKELD